ncbi:DNA mismatch repair protein MutS, partial [Acrasis kona]
MHMDGFDDDLTHNYKLSLNNVVQSVLIRYPKTFDTLEDNEVIDNKNTDHALDYYGEDINNISLQIQALNTVDDITTSSSNDDNTLKNVETLNDTEVEKSVDQANKVGHFNYPSTREWLEQNRKVRDLENLSNSLDELEHYIQQKELKFLRKVCAYTSPDIADAVLHKSNGLDSALTLVLDKVAKFITNVRHNQPQLTMNYTLATTDQELIEYEHDTIYNKNGKKVYAIEIDPIDSLHHGDDFHQHVPHIITGRSEQDKSSRSEPLVMSGVSMLPSEWRSFQEYIHSIVIDHNSSNEEKRKKANLRALRLLYGAPGYSEMLLMDTFPSSSTSTTSIQHSEWFQQYAKLNISQEPNHRSLTDQQWSDLESLDKELQLTQNHLTISQDEIDVPLPPSWIPITNQDDSNNVSKDQQITSSIESLTKKDTRWKNEELLPTLKSNNMPTSFTFIRTRAQLATKRALQKMDWINYLNTKPSLPVKHLKQILPAAINTLHQAQKRIRSTLALLTFQLHSSSGASNGDNHNSQTLPIALSDLQTIDESHLNRNQSIEYASGIDVHAQLKSIRDQCTKMINERMTKLNLPIPDENHINQQDLQFVRRLQKKHSIVQNANQFPNQNPSDAIQSSRMQHLNLPPPPPPLQSSTNNIADESLKSLENDLHLQNEMNQLDQLLDQLNKESRRNLFDSKSLTNQEKQDLKDYNKLKRNYQQLTRRDSSLKTWQSLTIRDKIKLEQQYKSNLTFGDLESNYRNVVMGLANRMRDLQFAESILHIKNALLSNQQIKQDDFNVEEYESKLNALNKKFVDSIRHSNQFVQSEDIQPLLKKMKQDESKGIQISLNAEQYKTLSLQLPIDQLEQLCIQQSQINP